MPLLNPRYAPVRILPGFGPAIIGIGMLIGRNIANHTMRLIEATAAQPPGYRGGNWYLERGPWEFSYYKGNATPSGPWPWLANPDLVFSQTTQPYQVDTGTYLGPDTGALQSSPISVDFFGNPNRIVGALCYETDRQRVVPPYDYANPDRAYRHSVWRRPNKGFPYPVDLRPTPVPGAPYVAYSPPAIEPMRDPNIARRMPALRPNESSMPWEAPSNPSPDAAGRPFAEPSGSFPSLHPRTSTSPAEVPPPIARRHDRAKPKRAKETKMLSMVSRVAIAGWKLLDTFSEFTEIGAAFWDALPPEVRRQCKGRAIQIGQYGSALTACQARVLVENWDKVDAVQAFKNLAKNAAEDMTIGQFHSWLDRMYPPGVSIQRTAATSAMARLQPERYIAMRLEELWEFLGI